MDILGFGGWEIFLIVVVALIIYGPARIVEIARSLGKMIHNFRKITSDLANQITSEIDEQKKLNETKKNETPEPNNDRKL